MLLYPEGDWKHFKGTGIKPFFFMCKFCGQIEYFSDSESYSKSCINCDHERWMGSNNFLPITLQTTISWFIHTSGWFKEELIAQLLESPIQRDVKMGKVLYIHHFNKRDVKS